MLVKKRICKNGQKPDLQCKKRRVARNIKVSHDALVLVIENNDTGKHNSEYMDYTIK